MSSSPCMIMSCTRTCRLQTCLHTESRQSSPAQLCPASSVSSVAPTDAWEGSGGWCISYLLWEERGGLTCDWPLGGPADTSQEDGGWSRWGQPRPSSTSWSTSPARQVVYCVYWHPNCQFTFLNIASNSVVSVTSRAFCSKLIILKLGTALMKRRAWWCISVSTWGKFYKKNKFLHKEDPLWCPPFTPPLFRLEKFEDVIPSDIQHCPFNIQCQIYEPVGPCSKQSLRPLTTSQMNDKANIC